MARSASSARATDALTSPSVGARSAEMGSPSKSISAATWNGNRRRQTNNAPTCGDLSALTLGQPNRSVSERESTSQSQRHIQAPHKGQGLPPLPPEAYPAPTLADDCRAPRGRGVIGRAHGGAGLEIQTEQNTGQHSQAQHNAVPRLCRAGRVQQPEAVAATEVYRVRTCGRCV